MPEIPAGTFDAERIAGELYDNDEFRSHYFRAAYERFPDCNCEQSFEAAEYILDRFAADNADRYSESEWEKISEALFEHIHAGLT